MHTGERGIEMSKDQGEGTARETEGEEMIQATDCKLTISQRAVHGMRAKRLRYASWYSAAVINSDGSVFEVRGSWDPAKIEAWLDSFGLAGTFALHTI